MEKFIKDGDVLTFSGHGINWTWYLKVLIVWPFGNMNVRILKHWRIHNGDKNHPKSVGGFTILENTKRDACAVHLTPSKKIHEYGDIYAAVENIKQVFEYG